MHNLKETFRWIFPIAIVVLIVAFLFYLGYRVSIDEHKIFSIGFLALIAGLLFESFRISDDWTIVIYIFLGSLIFSLWCFLPGKHEHNYNFEKHLHIWPYWFLVIFALVSGIVNKDKTTTKLTEVVTLIQSLSFIYWIIDYGFSDIDSWIVKFLITIALIFSIFTAFNALTYFVLSSTTRLILSIWSSLIMLLFAVDNIIKVFKNQDIESTTNILDGIYIGLQYFLLGISCMYIVQNFIMLLGFLPGKGSFFNSKYFREIRELKEDHLNRYSDQQVLIGNSVLCILLTGSIYWTNYKYHFIPTLTMIWFGIVFIPILLSLINLNRKRKFYR